MEPPFPSLTKLWHNAPYEAIAPTLPHLSLAGKTVVITGASRGIGSAAANAIAAAGPSLLALTARSQSNLDSVKSDLAKDHPTVKVLTFVADVTDAPAMNSAFAATKAASPNGQGIDILVHNAGYMAGHSLIGAADADTSDYWAAFEINLRGSYNATRAFLANLRPKSDANPTEPLLIGLSTAAVCFYPPPPAFSSYSTTMVAKAQFFQSVASENPDVRVVNVHPGAVGATDMGKKAAEGGIILPEDDVNLAGHFFVWLASKEGEWVKSKMVWVNWDVEELTAKKDKIMADPAYLNMGMIGWPYQA